MSDVQQIRDDLQYVRGVVARRERADFAPAGIMYVWVVYILVGYTLMDFRPQFAGPFFALGGIVGGIVSAILGRVHSQKVGEMDRTTYFRALLHFGGGIVAAAAGALMLGAFIGPITDMQTAQVFVVMIGLVYFLWGVHYQRYFMFLGPVVMAGGALVGRIHPFGWTLLGAVISLGLLIPTIFTAPVKRAAEAEADAGAQR